MNESEEAALAEDVVEDALLDGALRLRQPRRGHKAGTDAILLAAAAGVVAGEVFIDVGSGTGVVGLAIALRQPECRGCLLEFDPRLAELARDNVARNGFADRLSVACMDMFDGAARRSADLEGSATLVVSNPPFYTSGSVRPSANAQKAISHVLPAGGDHGAWLIEAVKLLRPRGRLVTIHRPDALPSLLQACTGRLGAIRLRTVHAHAGEPAIRILLEGKKGARGALTIMPPFILHNTDGRFTPEGEAVHRGCAMPIQTAKSRPEGPASD